MAQTEDEGQKKAATYPQLGDVPHAAQCFARIAASVPQDGGSQIKVLSELDPVGAAGTNLEATDLRDDGKMQLRILKQHGEESARNFICSYEALLH